MTSQATVLIISNDATCRDDYEAALEQSYPSLEVLTAPGFDGIVDHLDDGSLECIVSDAATVSSAPDLLQSTRERHPDVSLLVVSSYETDRGSGAALAETVDFIDERNAPATESAFADWVASTVFGGSEAHDDASASTPGELVREVKRSLVDASSPLDIEEAVCDQLTAENWYRFAWIGEYDRGEGNVIPWVSASGSGDWPTSMTFPVGRPERISVIDHALRTRELQIVDDVRTHRDAVPWRTAAIERGCTSVAVVPLGLDELHGVLGLYTTNPGGFDDQEVDAIREIGSSVSHVLDSIAIRGRIDQQERVLKRYERLVETVGDGMYALDSGGHIMTVNNALVSMTGYSREGLLGEHISIIFDDASVESGTELIQEMLSEKRMEGETSEVTLTTKDDQSFPCEVQFALLPFEDEYKGSVGVVRDITERKRRERELQRQNERLDAFASIVSHDLRNPLGVSQGYLDLVKTETDEELDEYIGYVEDGLARMEDIIEDVLTLARHGGTVAETAPTDLAALVEEAWANVETKEASLTVDESTVISVDRSRLLRACENLFRNAVEHGGSDVSVGVGLLREDETSQPVGFYVEDDGEGMPRDVRENAFDSDFTTAEDGFGIGLWVVSEIADAHGWSTRVVESSEGGARFEFSGVRTV
ncbi:PAS domain S-box protein [Haloarchaeobius sp. TZWWS8]|uniref:PAS domain S-box protein n=1 Tax=Haloarchaeobius sp. TZWWS8 TaxID=3446121 RepID=UPI003EB7895F